MSGISIPVDRLLSRPSGVANGRRPGGRAATPGGPSATLVLALGTFAAGTDAFVIAGFLPSVAETLRVSTADAREAITVFVVAYAIFTPLLAVATARVPRRALMVAALFALGLANLVSAFAPTLPVLIAARVLAAAGSAAYTPIAAAAWLRIVTPGFRVPALAATIGGVAAAVTLGLSLGDVAGSWLGWRAALGLLATVCLASGAGAYLTVPRHPGGPRRAGLDRGDRPGLPVVLSISLLGIVVGYGVYAYCLPALSAIGIPDAAAVLTLFVYGLGAMFANALTGSRCAGEERRRIARELHDSLTHNISLIKVQAGIAVHLARQRGEPVPDTLLAIQDASSEAMRELRATLGMLRDPYGAPAGSGLDRLPELVGRARAAGLTAAVTISGEQRPLPADVDRAAYRIVQEALTNIARHAGEASALVHVCYRPDALIVCVDDDGRATPEAPPAPGIGLTGMRERVTALGGRFHAGPRPAGGFGVRAEFPVPALGPPSHHLCIQSTEPSGLASTEVSRN